MKKAALKAEIAELERRLASSYRSIRELTDEITHLRRGNAPRTFVVMGRSEADRTTAYALEVRRVLSTPEHTALEVALPPIDLRPKAPANRGRR
jgi:hypothetical protein